MPEYFAHFAGKIVCGLCEKFLADHSFAKRCTEQKQVSDCFVPAGVQNGGVHNVKMFLCVGGVNLVVRLYASSAKSAVCTNIRMRLPAMSPARCLLCSLRF